MHACPTDCRLKVSGPYYEEFKSPAEKLSIEGSGATFVGASAEAAQQLTLQKVSALVETAVAAVMGTVPAGNASLVEAGLDSLGALLLSDCCQTV